MPTHTKHTCKHRVWRGARGTFPPLETHCPPWGSRNFTINSLFSPHFWLVDIAPSGHISERNTDTYVERKLTWHVMYWNDSTSYKCTLACVCWTTMPLVWVTHLTLPNCVSVSIVTAMGCFTHVHLSCKLHLTYMCYKFMLGSSPQ